MIPFKIVALIYIMIAGKPIVDEPFRFEHKTTFTDLDACQKYLTGQDFVMERAKLAKMVLDAVKDRDAVTDASPDPEDRPPVMIPGVAITASCEEDHSL